MASFVPERSWITPVASTRLLRYSVTLWKAFKDCDSVNYFVVAGNQPCLLEDFKSKQIISWWFKIRIKTFSPAALTKSSSSGWISPRLHLYYEWHPNLHWGLLIFCGSLFQITGHVQQISLQAMNNIICAPIIKQWISSSCKNKQNHLVLVAGTVGCVVARQWCGTLPPSPPRRIEMQQEQSIMTVIKVFRSFAIDTHCELSKRRFSALLMVVNICLLILSYRCYHPATLIKQHYAN